MDTISWSQPLSEWISHQQKEEQTLVPPVTLPPFITGVQQDGEKTLEGGDDYPFLKLWSDATPLQKGSQV